MRRSVWRSSSSAAPSNSARVSPWSSNWSTQAGPRQRTPRCSRSPRRRRSRPARGALDRKVGGDGDGTVAMSRAALPRIEPRREWMVKNAMRPPGRRRRRDALSTESLARSQHSTSVCTTASNVRPERQARALAATATRPFARFGQRHERVRGATLRLDVAEHDVTTGVDRQVEPGQPRPAPRSRVAVPARGQARLREGRPGPSSCTRWRPSRRRSPPARSGARPRCDPRRSGHRNRCRTSRSSRVTKGAPSGPGGRRLRRD